MKKKTSINDYLQKHALFNTLVEVKPSNKLNISVVIPCYNEPDVLSSLQSLAACVQPQAMVEVIVVINSSTNTCVEILEQNKRSENEINEWLQTFRSERLRFHVIHKKDLPPKHAGVGLARKIGMDEAARRFAAIGKPSGIITGFDADALVAKNYFVEIEKHYRQYPETTATSIRFEHPTEGTAFSSEIYSYIVQYELFLRYYANGLRFADFPFSCYTVGSSFSVKAEVYCKQGGMNRRKAGEDFYFLQKIIPLGNFHEINTTCVMPSPRPSDRVPFGTGAEIGKMLQRKQADLMTYNFQVFQDLKDFLAQKDAFFQLDKQQCFSKLDELPQSINAFLRQHNFSDAVQDINANSPVIQTFRKRFYQWFNAFRVLKYFNFAHEGGFEKCSVESQAGLCLQQKENIQAGGLSAKEILQFFRKIDRQSSANLFAIS